MRTVWPEFQRWFFSLVSPAEMVVLVACLGKTYELKWLWRLTQAPNSRYSLPENIKYFLDPYRVIEKYKTCTFNKTKSKIEAYELGVVWKYANNGSNLRQCLTVLLMCEHRRIFSPIQVLYHLLIALCQFSQSMKFSQGLFRTSGKRTWSQFVLYMSLGLSSPRNMTSSGSQAGEINILDLTEDRLLAQHQHRCVIESRLLIHWHGRGNERKKRCRTSAMGYPICKEPVCNKCWKEGYDKHINQRSSFFY